MPHITVDLVYNPDGTITSREPLEIKPGDTLAFSSKDGPVNVWLTPEDMFSATSFAQDSPPVQVLRSGQGRICWGLVVKGKVVGYPDNQSFGHDVET